MDIVRKTTESLLMQMAGKAGGLPAGHEFGPVRVDVASTPDGFVVRVAATPRLKDDLDAMAKAFDEQPPKIARELVFTMHDVIAENRHLKNTGTDFRIPWPIPDGFVYRGYVIRMSIPLPQPDGGEFNQTWRRFLETK